MEFSDEKSKFIGRKATGIVSSIFFSRFGLFELINFYFSSPKKKGKVLMRIERFKGKTVDHVQRHALEELTTKMKMKM